MTAPHALKEAGLSGGRLALGTVQFGMDYGVANSAGQVSIPEARKIVSIAADAGMDTIDTAIGYGDSERYLGEIGVGAFKVVTKLPGMPLGLTGVAGWVNEQMNSSLSRLGVAQAYGVLLHRPMELLGVNGQALFDALRAIKDRSLVKKIGVSVYSPVELGALTAKYQFDLVQAPLNLLDRRLAADGLLRRLKDRGIEIHTRSAFLQGLLLMPRTAVPMKFSRWDGLLNRWHQWLESYGETAVGACLAFPLSFPEVDRVVIGTENAEQLRRILIDAARLSETPSPDIACEDENLINPACWTNL